MKVYIHRSQDDRNFCAQHEKERSVRVTTIPVIVSLLRVIILKRLSFLKNFIVHEQMMNFITQICKYGKVVSLSRPHGGYCVHNRPPSHTQDSGVFVCRL